MKVLVCGSRAWKDEQAIRDRLRRLPETYGREITIIHGGCRGADVIAGAHALSLGFTVEEFVAGWNRQPDGSFDKTAGFQRNIVMLAQQPDLVLAFQLNGSTGTQHTIDEARKRGIPVEVISA